MKPLLDAFKNYARQDGEDFLLNGKDADLNRSGQVRVKNIVMSDDGTIFAEVCCYATICPPENESELDIAQEIVLDDWGFPGEWDGDAWYFYTGYFQISVEAPANVGTDDDAPLWAQALHKAIIEHPTVKSFDENMGALYDDMQSI